MVYEKIEELKLLLPARPTKPYKPQLKVISPSLEDINTYIEELERYTKEKDKYDRDWSTYTVKKNDIESKIEKLIKEESGLNTVVPEKYRDKVYSHAWEEGHSNGYYEVYLHLYKLVNIFE